MDDFFSPRSEGPEGGPESLVFLDPTVDLRVERRPWQLRSAQWRAWELAQAVFGGEVQVLLGGSGGPSTFRGMLTLRVPFPGLPVHKERERQFMSLAANDPLLCALPLIYVFEPWNGVPARKLP
jgi:hypothetical protein